MTDHARAIEAGARAIDPDAYEPINEARWESLARLESQAAAQLNAERKAKACIKAAIASGELVPASAVAAERERCAQACDASSRAYEALISSQESSVLKHRTEGMAHGTKLAASKIRSLSPAPASGEFVVVPRADLQVVVDIAGRNESAIEIECIKEWLKDAATKDGEPA